MARRDALSVDVAKNATNRALQHVAAEASCGLATVECRLDSVGDGVHHGIHGRGRSALAMSSPRTPRRSSVFFFFLLLSLPSLLFFLVSGERVRDNVLSEKCCNSVY